MLEKTLLRWNVPWNGIFVANDMGGRHGCNNDYFQKKT
jgi:hypothetical protein